MILLLSGLGSLLLVSKSRSGCYELRRQLIESTESASLARLSFSREGWTSEPDLTPQFGRTEAGTFASTKVCVRSLPLALRISVSICPRNPSGLQSSVAVGASAFAPLPRNDHRRPDASSMMSWVARFTVKSAWKTHATFVVLSREHSFQSQVCRTEFSSLEVHFSSRSLSGNYRTYVVSSYFARLPRVSSIFPPPINASALRCQSVTFHSSRVVCTSASRVPRLLLLLSGPSPPPPSGSGPRFARESFCTNLKIRGDSGTARISAALLSEGRTCQSWLSDIESDIADAGR